MQKPAYKIPKNLCQVCYETGGRFIMDCYCILCEECYARMPNNIQECTLCGKPTKGNKIDAKQPDSIKKISHFFQNIDIGLNKIRSNYQFQNEIVTRYCEHLEKQLNRYQEAVNELIQYNPNLHSYFKSRVRLTKKQQNQPYQTDRHSSLKTETTIKPQKSYHPEVSYSKSTQQRFQQRNDDPPGLKRIGPQSKQNLSGNAIYKVPNLNINTAMRSNKRSNKLSKMEPDDYDLYQKYRRN